MKKVMLMVVIALAAVCIVSAQGFGWGSGQTVSVQGTLGLQNGVIALTSGGTVYYVPHLSRYVGFIDGLKEGAQVKVDGYRMGAGAIMPVKITVNGKDYDFSGAYGMTGGYCGSGTGHHGMGRW